MKLNFYKVTSQLPPRLNIPGALLLPQSKPNRQRIHSLNSDIGPLPRLRRPIPNANSAPIRPVVEEPEDNPQTPQPQQIDNNNNNNNNFDDEVTKLGISALQSAVRQAVTNGNNNDDDDDNGELPAAVIPQRPVQFRPERPLPLLRQDIRDTPRPLPVLRQDSVKPQIRIVPVRQQAQPPQQQQQQQYRQIPKNNPTPTARQPSQYIDQDDDRQTSRRKKPIVQILRKYRTDNPDGSITWGYENEDGTFKEETLGIDCMTRGKYGYVDPDGVRRQYTYETGNKCDQREEQEDDALLQNKQPLAIGGQTQNRKSQQQFRPLPSQY